MEIESLAGSKHFVTFIDDFRRTAVSFMKEKSDVLDKFKECQEWVGGERIGTLRSDRGGEYMSQEFEQYLKAQKIAHQVAAANCPQQNGIAERTENYANQLEPCSRKPKCQRSSGAKP